MFMNNGILCLDYVTNPNNASDYYGQSVQNGVLTESVCRVIILYSLVNPALPNIINIIESKNVLMQSYVFRYKIRIMRSSNTYILNSRVRMSMKSIIVIIE